MADERKHAAFVRLGVADHQLDLGAFLLALSDVELAPAFGAARQIFGRIDHGAAMDPEFFQRLIEDVGIDADAALDDLLGLRIGGAGGSRFPRER